VPPIRVYLTGLSHFRRDLVQAAVLAQHDMIVVSEFIDGDTMLSARAADLADVVIVGMDEERVPTICGLLLHSHPGIRVLALEERGGNAILYELRPHRNDILDISVDTLAEAIRSGAGASRRRRVD
jgi:hypothetical protein